MEPRLSCDWVIVAQVDLLRKDMPIKNFNKTVCLSRVSIVWGSTQAQRHLSIHR